MTGTERKALNKYYPPDFDPRKIPKVKGPRNRQYVIRVMAPFNMTCNTCGEYIYKGKKFNARRETVEDDDYLGLFLFRFYIRCPRCLAEITFKTDLKNCDYAAEHGSTRLFEAERALQEMEKEKERKEEEDKQNAMKQLEKRTKMSRFEMEAIERLEELRELKHREGKVDFVNALAEVTKQQREDLERQEREDDEFVKRLFAKDGEKRIKRLRDDSDEDEDEELDDGPGTSSASSSRIFDGDPMTREKDKPALPFKKPKPELNQKKLLAGVVVKKNKQSGQSTITTKSKAEAESKTSQASGVSSAVSSKSGPSTTSSGLNLLGAYSDSSDEQSD